MAETNFQKQVLGTLIEMKTDIESLKKEVGYLTEYIEDTKLTGGERKELEESISKVKAGSSSDFVSWKKAKRELGI